MGDCGAQAHNAVNWTIDGGGTTEPVSAKAQTNGQWSGSVTLESRTIGYDVLLNTE